MELLFKPILKNLNYFSTSSLCIKISNDIYNVFVKLAIGIFDFPAKAAVLNAKQFNGKHGCSVCVHPGQR